MFNTVTTKDLYQNLAQLSSVHTFLANGLFPGHASQHLVNAARYIEHLHELAEKEFKSRPDYIQVVNEAEGKDLKSIPGIKGA